MQMRNLCKRCCIPLEGVAFNSLSTTSVNYSVLVFWKRTTLSFPTIKSINQLIIQTFCVEQRASRMLMHTQKNESARTLIKNNLPLKSGFYRLPKNSNWLPRNSTGFLGIQTGFGTVIVKHFLVLFFSLFRLRRKRQNAVERRRIPCFRMSQSK
jgi:hypothetical protein